MLINSVKDVASALGDLIHATKSASGKNISDPAMIYLKDSAKVSTKNNYFFFSLFSRPLLNYISVGHRRIFSLFFFYVVVVVVVVINVSGWWTYNSILLMLISGCCC